MEKWLYAKAKEGDLDEVNKCLGKVRGAQLDAATTRGATALWEAAARGHAVAGSRGSRKPRRRPQTLKNTRVVSETQVDM